MSHKMKRTTWTFQPTHPAVSLMSKACHEKSGRGANFRGLRSQFINEAIVAHLGRLRGKRERI